MAPVGRVLGIDPGERRVGLAISDSDRRVATPLATIRRDADVDRYFRDIAEIAEEWEVGQIVVGLPVGMDGTIGAAGLRALAEADRLGVTTGRPVQTYDERLTTVTAERVLREQGLDARRRKDVVDQVAASVMLQAWLDHEATPTSVPPEAPELS